MPPRDTEPLLPSTSEATEPRRPRLSPARAACTLVAGLLLIAIVYGLAARGRALDSRLPDDPLDRARALLALSPLIDTHIDTPILIRERVALNLDEVDLRRNATLKHVDIPRLRAGGVGAVFWSVFVECPDDAGYGNSPPFVEPTFRVRDTLEQIDLVKQMVAEYDDTFVLADSARDIQRAHAAGKIASLMGVEGGHQIGNSLAVLRQYRALGVRYMTLTHSCNNALADTCGYQSKPVPPAHHGLSAFGRAAVREMNRIGMLVDASHTSAETAHAALSLSRAPVIFSHSNARAIWNVSRNVDDAILERIRRADEHDDRTESGVPAGDALVSATAAGYFVAPGTSTLSDLADHIDALGRLAGRSHVGIGSDFDGVPIDKTPIGFEDSSRYPYLLAELITRGWSDDELFGLMGRNMLRVLDAADRVAAKMGSARPSAVLYSERPDLPMAHPPDL